MGTFLTSHHFEAQEIMAVRLEATLQVMCAIDQGSQVGLYGMPTLSGPLCT
jgi:hypothetical protein